MPHTETKAWKVTEANTHVLHTISNVDERAFKQNIGWVLIEDWSCTPRFILTPERIFNDIYPKVELTELEVDRDAKPLYTKAVMEQLLEKAIQLGFTDDIMHWRSELKKENFA